MKIKKEIVGSIAVLGVLTLAVKKNKKDIIRRLTNEIYDSEMESDMKYWSVNQTMENEFKSYNKQLKSLEKDCKDYDERLYLLEDEIICIYNHLAELDEIKESKNN